MHWGVLRHKRTANNVKRPVFAPLPALTDKSANSKEGSPLAAQGYMNKMDCYMDFARIYDSLMAEDIDYSAIADYIEACWARMGDKPQLVLDLACGTGTLTTLLAKRGYDMIGVDLSCEMLNIAREKDDSILYLCQDMREFELYGTVDAIVCMTDSLNYITDDADLLQVFRLAKNYLNPGAPFLFDMNSLYKLETILGNNTYTYDSDSVYYVWENEYDAATRLCDFYLTFFVAGKDGAYTRFDEHHTQRAYTLSEVTDALRHAGFCDIQVFGAYGSAAPAPESERLLYIAR